MAHLLSVRGEVGNPPILTFPDLVRRPDDCRGLDRRVLLSCGRRTLRDRRGTAFGRNRDCRDGITLAIR